MLSSSSFPRSFFSLTFSSRHECGQGCRYYFREWKRLYRKREAAARGRTAVKDQRIVFVGSNEDAKTFRGDETCTVDLGCKTVVPGLTDSHCHIFGIGEREMRLNLEGTNSLEGFLSKVKARVSRTEKGKWVTGRGWIETFWKPPQFPSREDLDKIAPDNPVFTPRRRPGRDRERRRDGEIVFKQKGRLIPIVQPRIA